ncbi:MAG: cache domain-containing protein [Pseudomonadota bacterium]
MKRAVQSFFLTAVLLFFVSAMAQAETLTPQLCKDKAEAAAKLLEAEGAGAIDKIKDENGEFRFAGGEGYIWIHNLEGVMVMHPIKPSLDGRDLLDMKDINGVYLFSAMNELVEAKGKGWVPYAWPKPGQQESSPKVSYVILVKKDGKNYVAGSGMYDVTADDIKKMFPGDAIYSAE